ncbi:MFS transporter [Microbacterium sp. ARD32]|uniref:MFS transporter n=1 Tax=Microbacterium sp. ARD32 TaxID=2962577 RepID=UPI0028825E0D|nr:MFS transporter [Microbacterium sp. ARD32]MDT0158714.1 MFS transporter [Microbacterium sp. ARD32]
MTTVDGAPTAVRPTPRRTRTGALVLLVLTSALLLMDTSLISLLIEPMRRDLRFSDAELGLLQGAFPTIAFAVCALPIGLLVDRFSRARMILIALIAWALALVLIVIAPGFALLAVAKVLIGCVQAVLITAPFSLAADLTERRRRSTAVAALTIGQSLGAALGFVLGGVVFTAMSAVIDTEPWRVTVLIFAAAGVLLIPFFIRFREPERTETDAGTRSTRALFSELRRHAPVLWPLFIGYAFAQVGASLLQVWAAPALMRRYGLSELVVGNMVGVVMFVGGIVGAVLAGWVIELLRRRNRRGAVAIGLAAVVLGAAGSMALMPTGAGGAAVFGIGVAASAFIGTGVPAFLMLYLPNELRGLAGGALVLFGVGPGATIGPSAVAAISGALPGAQGLAQAMALTGVCAGVLSFAFFALLSRFTGAAASGSAPPRLSPAAR